MMAQSETQYVTIEEAARILKDEMEANGWRGGANTIKSWIIRQSLPRYRQGRRQVVSLDDVRRYIRENGRQGEVRPWE